LVVVFLNRPRFDEESDTSDFSRTTSALSLIDFDFDDPLPCFFRRPGFVSTELGFFFPLPTPPDCSFKLLDRFFRATLVFEADNESFFR